MPQTPIPASSPPVVLDNVAKTYDGQVAVRPTTLSVEAHRICVLIGPSGCGKSTLLRMILGLVRPDQGRVLIAGEELDAENAVRLRRAIGYVVQDGGLFPHLTAGDNVTLLARYLGRDPAWIAARLSELAALVRLPAAALARYPLQLSGGQRQRVGIMRALMLDPPLLLLDEPLGALDPVTRFELQEELKQLFLELRKTVVLVTHDMNEAAHFGDHIVLLRAGAIVQQGSLEELLARPAEPYVRDFIRAQRSTLPQ
ncbi:MAG TPA: ATP-binding cassette domain-containing protein [Burkholderiales bacterium]|nr:ATP-binding cassette domain-containing protein [Burkholderiales bacterium]